jgi:hypothetical protein
MPPLRLGVLPHRLWDGSIRSLVMRAYLHERGMSVGVVNLALQEITDRRSTLNI